MSLLRLMWRNLVHYRGANLALLLGVATATAVLAGALVVGDSMRFSLKRLTLLRLGEVDLVLSSPRFFTEGLVDRLASPRAKMCPALVLQGSLELKADNQIRRSSQVSIVGLDENGWNLLDHRKTSLPEANQIILNSAVARALRAKVNDKITLWQEIPATIPRDSLLGQKDQATREIELTVSAILETVVPAGRFSLVATQELPATVFVNLRGLQSALDLSELRPSKSEPTGRPRRVNTILVSTGTSKLDREIALGNESLARLQEHTSVATELNRQLPKSLQLDDLNWKVTVHPSQKFVQVESGQLLVEPELSLGAQRSASSLGWSCSPVYVALANRISNAAQPQKYSMYSTVAGVDLLTLGEQWGELTFIGRRPESLGENEIIINEFLAEDLDIKTGESLTIDYHQVGSKGELPEEQVTFRVAGIVAMSGLVADRRLAPEVKGITDVDNLSQWEQPFPMKLDLVTTRDEDYWDAHRATPKAFVNLKVAQNLWPSRYGNLTNLRIIPAAGAVETAAKQIETELLKNLDTSRLGLSFQPSKLQGIRAATGATDFTGLFLGFSMFLIAAAVMLVYLLFRLSVDQRVAESGLLSSVGISPNQLRMITYGEACGWLLAGVAVGLVGAMVYGRLVLIYLQTWGRGAVGSAELVLSVAPTTLLSAAIGIVAAGLLAIRFALQSRSIVSLRSQLSGTSTPPLSSTAMTTRRTKTQQMLKGILAISGVLLVVALAGWLPKGEAFPGLAWDALVFFVLGFCILGGGLSAIAVWFDSNRLATLTASPTAAQWQLAIRNACRARQRSLLSTALIALATFVVVAVAAGRMEPAQVRPEKQSGNGGFSVVGKATTPLLFDLSTVDGRQKLNINASPPFSLGENSLSDRKGTISFRVKPGDEASCLNLFQAQVPSILGVPREMLERGGFQFAGVNSANPWELLEKSSNDGTIAVFGDMATLMFGLKKNIGDIIEIPNGQSGPQNLRVAGMFSGSLFQGQLLMSEANFLRLFPERKGTEFFLFEAPEGQTEGLIDWLETQLAPFGFDAEPVSVRLERFYAVQNTYLSTFMMLGGLGVVLGTIGLAIVMLRNILERRSELAVLRAMGFTQAAISRVILFENSILLGSGVAIGAVSALFAMLPHLRSSGAHLPWTNLTFLLVTILVFGSASVMLAARDAAKGNLVSNLRGE